MTLVKELVKNLVAELRTEDGEYTFVDDPGYPGIAWKGKTFLSFFQGPLAFKWAICADGANDPVFFFYGDTDK